LIHTFHQSDSSQSAQQLEELKKRLQSWLRKIFGYGKASIPDDWPSLLAALEDNLAPIPHEKRKLKVITDVIQETYVYHYEDFPDIEDVEDDSHDYQVDGGQVD
jgi:hypothetical protein